MMRMKKRMMMTTTMSMALEFCRLTFAMTSSVHFLLVVEGAAPLSDNGGDEDEEDNLGTMMMMTLAMVMLMTMVMMTNMMKSSVHKPGL